MRPSRPSSREIGTVPDSCTRHKPSGSGAPSGPAASAAFKLARWWEACLLQYLVALEPDRGTLIWHSTLCQHRACRRSGASLVVVGPEHTASQGDPHALARKLPPRGVSGTVPVSLHATLAQHRPVPRRLQGAWPSTCYWLHHIHSSLAATSHTAGCP